MRSWALVSAYVFCFIHNCVGKFTPPEAHFEVIYPTGFNVSIPDVEGITQFGFHGSPSPINNREVGRWAHDVTKPRDGFWTYTNLDAQLNTVDKIYYWTYIIYDGAGYRHENGVWTVPTGSQIVDPPKLNARFSQSVSAIRNSPVTHNIASPVTTSSPSLPGSAIKCDATLSKVRNSGNICAGDLLFESNFDKLDVFKRSWAPEVVFPEAPDYPFVVYMEGDHISLKHGLLTIKPTFLEDKFGEGFRLKSLTLQECTGETSTRQCERNATGSQILPPIISGKLTTKDSFSFKYGRIEVVAKLAGGDWILSEILLEPRDNKYGSSHYASGIMKVASIKGNEKFSRNLIGGVIMDDADIPFSHLKYRDGPSPWSKGFYNYTLVWKPDEISLYVDGEKYGNIGKGPSFSKIGKLKKVAAASKWARGSKIAPFDELFYISLVVRVGGIKDFEDEDEIKPWKNVSSKAAWNFWKLKKIWAPTWSDRYSKMQVYSIRVYAL